MARRATFRMQLKGAKELEEALRELPNRIAKSAVRRALIKAAKPIEMDAKQRVHVRSGRLFRRIAVSTTLSRRQRRTRAKGATKGQIDVFIGAGPARHAHLVEFGSGPRRHKRTGKATGVMPAFPFLRPAWDAGKLQALDEFGRLLWIEIAKAAKRLARKSLAAARR